MAPESLRPKKNTACLRAIPAVRVTGEPALQRQAGEDPTNAFQTERLGDPATADAMVAMFAFAGRPRLRPRRIRCREASPHVSVS